MRRPVGDCLCLLSRLLRLGLFKDILQLRSGRCMTIRAPWGCAMQLKRGTSRLSRLQLVIKSPLLPRSFCRSSPGVSSRNAAFSMASAKASVSLPAAAIPDRAACTSSLGAGIALYCADFNKQGLPRLLQGPSHGGSVEVKRRLWPAQPWASMECFVNAIPFCSRI